jgi:hypothetical protein
MSKEAMKLALKELEDVVAGTGYVYQHKPSARKAIKALEEALAKQEHGEPVGEVVAWPNDFERVGVDWISYVPDVGTKLYTTPQQRTWVGLTDEECRAVWYDDPPAGTYIDKIRQIEAKLKEKNT